MKSKRGAQNSGGSAARGKPFAPGISGNPGGRPRMPEDLKALLKADSIRLYMKANELLEKAEMVGDLDLAGRLVLGLLKKSIPDTNQLLVSDPDGGPVKVMRVDPKTLTTEQLDALIALQKAQNGGP